MIQMKVSELERALEEWVAVGRSRGASSARTLSAALDADLHKEAAALSDCATAQTRLTQLTEVGICTYNILIHKLYIIIIYHQ